MINRFLFILLILLIGASYHPRLTQPAQHYNCAGDRFCYPRPGEY